MGGLASRGTPPLTVVLWSQAAGFLVLGVALPFVPGAPQPGDFAWGGACGVIGAAAVGLLYRGLAVGTMGVVSPVTAVLAALLPIGFGVIGRHQMPSAGAWAGIVCALVAVVAIAAAPAVPGRSPRRGLPEAVAAGSLFGAFFIGLAQTRPEAGLYPLVGARAASFLAVGAAGILGGVSLRPRGRGAVTILAGGVCDMLANVLFVVAAHGGTLAIVAVLTSLYPASTVALAAIVLRERLRPLQWGGVAAALAAVGLLTANR